ncbi:MAG: hypothetical protein GYA16_12920 [Spirochaetes bacterium]|nr:hypothetical protein [Spirochaetota bacterium]
MVTKIVEKMTLIILLTLFFAECATMDNSLITRDILLFENYYQNEIILPEEYLLSKGNIYYNDSLLVKKESLLQTQGEKITGELFDVLCSLDMINQWNIYKESDINPYSSKHDEFIEKRKQELELFYLGKLKISKNFNSFLILISTRKNDDYNVIKTVLLINVADNKVASITRICNYTCFDGECNYIYTVLSEKGVFLQKNKEACSDVILPKEMKSENEKTGIKFIYDRKGYLKTH